MTRKVDTGQTLWVCPECRLIFLAAQKAGVHMSSQHGFNLEGALQNKVAFPATVVK